jgi:hypothetical protein
MSIVQSFLRSPLCVTKFGRRAMGESPLYCSPWLTSCETAHWTSPSWIRIVSINMEVVLGTASCIHQVFVICVFPGASLTLLLRSLRMAALKLISKRHNSRDISRHTTVVGSWIALRSHFMWIWINANPKFTYICRTGFQHQVWGDTTSKLSARYVCCCCCSAVGFFFFSFCTTL